MEGFEINSDFYTPERLTKELLSEKDRVHVVTLPWIRPGSFAFGALMEFHYYPPSQPLANIDFNVRSIEWQGVYWAVYSFTLNRLGEAKSIAAVLGFRFGGCPVVLDRAGPSEIDIHGMKIKGHYFPGSMRPDNTMNPNLYQLETMAEPDSLLSSAEINARENQMINKFADGILLRPVHARDFIWRRGEFADPGATMWYLSQKI